MTGPGSAKRYVVLAVIAALLWSGYWVIQARSLRGQIEGWFDARRAEGWTAEYTDLAIRGFPSRLDATISGIDLSDPETGIGWQTPFLQILGLSYRHDHSILAFADSQTLRLPGGAQDITSDGLRASLVRDGGEILRLNVEADTFNIARDGADLAIAGLLANFHRDAEIPEQYRLTVAAQAMATPANAVAEGTSDGLDIRATLAFDRPWTLAALEGPRPQPRRIDLARARYKLEGLELDVAGQLDIGPEGRADGALTVRAVNWRALLDQARESGTLPQALVDTLTDGLSLAASLAGRSDTLDLPLRFSRGELSFGIIPLGQAPRFTLP